MEAFAVLIGFGLLVVVFGLPIYAAVVVMDLKRRVADAEQRNGQRWVDLNTKIFQLEKRVHEWEEHPAQGVAPAAHEASAKIPPIVQAETSPASVPEKQASTPAAPPPKFADAQDVIRRHSEPEVAPSQSAAQSVATPPGTPGAPATPVQPKAPVHDPLPHAATSAPQPPQRIAPPSSPVTPPVHAPAASSSASSSSSPPSSSPPRTPSFSVTPHMPSILGDSSAGQKPARSGIDLEEILGTNWLNKIGIVILVLGVAFFLAYQIQHLGPAGKVLLGLALSGGMIAVGVRYETNERYRILARAIAAGGWGLLFFLSYAVYHLDATKVIESRELDFILMIAVAAAIVWYSMRYRSQSTTALALVLAYLTVGIHHTSVYSLIASVILAATVVWIALRMRWFVLETCAIVATYFNHFLWVSPHVEAMGGRKVEFEGFRTSLLLLVFYWLLFRFSYIYRKPNEDEEHISTAAALMNGICLLGMMKYQSVHPEWTFWALMTLGWIELGLAALAATRRRVAFVVLATIGSALIVASFPFRYSGADLSWFWLIAAQAFFVVGVFTREIVFRRMGTVTIYLVSTYMLFVTGAPLIAQLIDSTAAGPFYSAAWLFGSGSLVCYFNSHWVRRRWPELFEHEFDAETLAIMTYVGGALALLAVWFAIPGLWTAVVWAALSLAMNFVGKKISKAALRVQGEIVAIAAIARLITLNFTATEQWHGMSLRMITVGMTALLLYVGAAISGAAAHDQKQEDEISSTLAIAHTWAATILLYVLAWYELAPMRVALAWVVGGMVLLEIGLWLKARFLCWQAYAALIATFFRIAIVNLQEAGAGTGISLRIYTVSFAALAFFYVDWRVRIVTDSPWKEPLRAPGAVFAYLGTISVAALLYYEMSPAWVAAGWAGMALALIAVAYATRRKDFLYQSIAMALAVALRVMLWNFWETSSVAASIMQTRAGQTGIAVALLFAALPLAFLWRAAVKDENAFPLEKRPEQVFFFVPFGLLTILVALEATSKHLTVAWGIEALVVFIFALLVGERSFRLSGLGLLLVCVVKIMVLDVWGLDPQWRYITLIALGAALVLVSFLYTRYKEKFRQYL